MKQNYTVEDLQYLMSQLRNPDGGCPWDLKQTFASIVPSTIEEAYEVAEAIEQEDFEHLHEELRLRLIGSIAGRVRTAAW